MIYLWIYLTLGVLFIGWLIYWSVNHEGESLYIRDIWKIVLSYIAWPFIGLIWLWLILDRKYNLKEKLEEMGDKRVF